ncbi:hypothetical protein [Azospirillum rugosum]|uniref:Uncharacterized protein n=1 Tax=Azospirillum rugosum TaxID=416170 RepID=A0ABS4SEK9_9PROT|nr:hypothetical protein [Azospirillum rugosum]MBP2291021.1 hypothetical protein [Azospirillum rugosum]MDQ0524915.1 hypothetical protein [Azospirillum rugosum]
MMRRASETSVVSALHPNDVPPVPPDHAQALAVIDDLWARGIKVPVEKLGDLNRLDADEIRDGYMEGISPDSPEPGNNRSRAFWHGWRNARIDRGHHEKDEAAKELARRAYWWACRAPATGRVADEPDRYADLESALERGELV